MATASEPIFPGQRPVPTVAGVTHKAIMVDGTRIHVAECGIGKPVLLLHSFPQHWFEWRLVLPLLKDEYHLICVDMPGFGWSDGSPRGYSTVARAQDVLAVMDALDLQQVDLIGHGWGAITGFRLCLDAPDRVKHFLAINVAQPWLSRRIALQNAWRQWHTVFWEYPLIGRRVLSKLPAITRLMMRHWSVNKEAAGKVTQEYAVSSSEPLHAWAGEQLNWQYVLHDIPQLIIGSAKRCHLSVPTVLLAGDKDVLIPPIMSKGGERYADDISLTVVPNTGQLLPEENPGAVAQSARQLFR